MAVKPGGSVSTLVAVAHPHVEHARPCASWRSNRPSSSWSARDGRDLRHSRIRDALDVHDAAAELLRHGLHAVADAEHRHAERRTPPAARAAALRR